jgi:hypothetical protein
MDSERLFGGRPIAVAIRLVVLSIVVGVVMSALELRPDNVLHHLRLLAGRLYALGFGAIEGVIGYLLLGAVVVVPIWLVTRLLGVFGRRGNRRD